MSQLSSPTVSFVVPCYNYGRFLEDCLKSILLQDEKYPYEIIVLDDASTDDTKAIIEKFSSDLRIVSIFHPRNQGHVDTINEGFSRARGKYIARIDADDRYRPNFLSETVPVLDAHPSVGMVYGNHSLIDEKGNVSLERGSNRPDYLKTMGNEFLDILKLNYICAPTVIARKEAWQKGLPIPTGVSYSDWYLSVQIARHFPLYYVDKAIADYRVHKFNHHAQIVKDGREEKTTMALLDRFFNEKEVDAELQDKKIKAKEEIYANQYLTAARKYFGSGLLNESRRCYLRAIKLYPPILLSSELKIRHVVGSFLGQEIYGLMKGFK